MMNFYVHATAVIDAGAAIGKGTTIWHFSHIYGGATIGRDCTFGQNTMVSDGVTIGDNVKVQNNVAIYSGTTVEDDVFLGPSCVLTNISNPRSQVVRRGVYESTRIRQGATIGANATIVCGVTLGRYCFVSAGAVVTKDVPDYALVMGVPAKQAGWMSRHGHVLAFAQSDTASCPESGLRYHLSKEVNEENTCHVRVRCLDIPETDRLPQELSMGRNSYSHYKQPVHDRA